MIELLAALSICLADWGCAASHMAFRDYVLSDLYWRKIPVWGDVWHLVAGLRYLPMGLLAWLAYNTAWEWYLITGCLNYAGWQVLKRLHGKDWPPIWRRWI